MHNRRQYSRISFHTEARLYTAGDETAVSVIDISLKGALLQPGKLIKFPANTTADLQIRLDELGTTIQMSGEITHCNDGFLGLKCLEIDLDSITHLRRLVELNLGDEQLLERELSHLLSE